MTLILAGFNSCNKEKGETSQPSLTSVQTKSMEVDFPIIENPLPMENYFVNKEDADDEIINNQLYEIGLVARFLFIDNILNDYIYSKASNNDNSCVDLRELTSDQELRELVDNKDAFDELKNIVDNVNLTHKSNNPEDNGKTEEYIPAIFVANIENADFNELPIFSPGIDVNPEIPGAEEYDDYLVAWLLEDNGLSFS